MKSQKELRKAYKESERKKFMESLPMAEKLFPKLFDFIDKQLAKKDCDYTLKNAQIFFKVHKINNEDEVIAWLNDNGGFCDCEVVNNISEHFGWYSKLEPELDFGKDFNNILAKKKKINALKTDFGFEIHNVPAPWKMSESIENEQKTYFFQIGKGLSICLATLQTENVANQLDNDDFWLKSKTEKEPVFNELERYDWQDFTIIIGKSMGVKVKIWIIPKFDERWHLELTTEKQRYKGDLKELEKLLANVIR